jgi:hypothetical protein
MSSNPSGALIPTWTALPSASTALSGINQHQNSQTYDAPFVSVLADSLPDDHNDPYVPSEEGDESDDSEQASYISNSEVCFFLSYVVI